MNRTGGGGIPCCWELRCSWLPSLTGFIPSFPTEDTYERRIMVDKEEVTLIVYDIWEQVRPETRS